MPKAKAAPEPPPAEVPAEPAEEETAEEPEELPEEPVHDHPRGYVGWVYEDAFKELYQPAPKAAPAPAEPSPGGGEDAPEGEAEGEEAAREAPRPEDADVDLSAEDAEIAALHAQLEREQERLGGVLGSLRERHGQASQRDREDAEHLQKRWGLTMREQYPVGDSKLRTLLEPGGLKREGLVYPAGALQDLERQIEIQKGTVPQHENLLAVSKPEEPNHYKTTATQKLRMQTRNIQPTVTAGQRAAIARDLEERRRRQPPAPAVLGAEERARNREIVKRMQTKVNFLKNPRYQADRAGAARGEACPFAIVPDSLVFRNYEVGGVFELDCEFRNTAQVGRRLRVLPCPNPCFSVGALRYDGDASGQRAAGSGAVVAPGMAARLTVRFAPETLNDATEELVVGTEVGDFKLPLLARRVQPRLELQQPVDCGCILAGNSADQSVRLCNRGGEGSFRLIPSDEEVDPSIFAYEERGDVVHIVSPEFGVSPASFYLEAGQSIDLQIHFEAPEVGQHYCPLLVECDNGVRTPLALVGITDAVRLELVRWPTSEVPLVPQEEVVGVSPWAYVPWHLSWLDPGAQVGGTPSQSICISNGGYLPVKVQWRLAQPPRSLLSKLSVGFQPRLTEELLHGTRDWSTCNPRLHGTLDCPFTVQPAVTVVQPFSTVEFAFCFHAHEPVGRRSTAFACLEATEIPATGKCLPHYGRLLQLQEQMQPEDYQKGLPLFGGAVSGRFDVLPPPAQSSGPGTASCTVTAVCLQGVSVRPSVTCQPPAITLPGTVLPFVAQVRELRLQNAGDMPACFRVRLSSAGAATGGPLWILGAHEAGTQVQASDAPEEEEEADPELSELRRRARRLAEQWPPLPPHGQGAQALPGYGASASVVVEPWEGLVPSGAEIALKVTIRAPREGDIDGQIIIDLPISLQAETDVPPLAVAVLGAVRSPRVGLRHTASVDFGVVRAHAQHTRTLKVNNPSDLPMLVKLRQSHSDQDNPVDNIGPLDPLMVRMSSYATPAYTISSYQLPYKPEAKHSTSAWPVDFHGIFSLGTHQEVVDMFTSAVESGSRAGFTAVPLHEPVSAAAEPWVHAKSGCLDKSGRRASSAAQLAEREHGHGQGQESDDFIFSPECLVLWPRQTVEVEITLRTGAVGQYYSLVEAVGFDSLHSQCVEVFAEVQLPRLCISTQHCHFPVTYEGTPSEPKELSLRNNSDLPASFHWAVPSKPSGCLEVQISPSEGTVPPRGELGLVVRAQPPRRPEGGRLARLACPLFAHELLQPIMLMVSAKVYGPEVDYAVVAMDERAPQPKEARRGSGQEDGTYPVTTGRAKRGLPIVDFGEMELLKSKSMQVFLYNRTGIGTPFTAKVRHYPADEPQEGPRSRACQLEEGEASPGGRPQPFDFSSEPRAAPAAGLEEEEGKVAPTKARGGAAGPRGGAQGRGRANKFEPKARRAQGGHAKAGCRKKRFLLDDKHEKQSFRSTGGAALAQQKEEKEQGMAALQKGRGWAVQVQVAQEVLQPFAYAVITLTCFSDLPGLLEDELVLNIPELSGHADGQDFRIPIRLVSFGNPLYLPEQQVGLNLTLDPPRLLCGIIVPSEKLTTRRFRVGNNSSARMKIAWKIYATRQLETSGQDRQLVTVALCKRRGETEALLDVADADQEDESLEEIAGPAEGEVIPDDEMPCLFKLWAQEPPEVKDPFAISAEGEPPLKIEPEEAVIPVHGTTSFTVTLLASKATFAAGNHYSYKLVGKGAFAQDRHSSLGTPGAEGGQLLESTMLMSKDAEVRCLPAVPLDAAGLHDSDSDAEAEQATRLASRISAGADAAEEEEAGADGRISKSAGPRQLLASEPDEGVISTIIIDCVGDCILPRLTVDKKNNPSEEDFQPTTLENELGAEPQAKLYCPVFKFVHSVLTPPLKKPSGATHGAFPGSAQLPGVVSYMVRNVTLANNTACNIACSFRVEGPFRIREIAQVGRHPVKPASDPLATRKRASKTSPAEDPLRQRFVVAKMETVTLQVEFALDMVDESEWTQHRTEHTFKGDIIVEYPRDVSDENSPMDLQRVHLVGCSRRPAVRVTLQPRAELDRPLLVDHADLPHWGKAEPVIVDFGNVHVEAAVTRRRVILLSNVTNVLAKWQLLHVGRKKRPPQEIGQTTREEEETRALDEKDAFEFDVTEGDLMGPSKDGILPDTKERQPHWSPPLPGVARAPASFEEEKYEPQRIQIAFRPKRNELYKCKFRIQVEYGLSVDFVCRGCGSYEEEDDATDFLES